MSELKPCPFCGGEARFQIFDTTCNVECQQCGIGTRNELLDNYQVCVYKWNRSADDNLNADVTNLKSDEISLTPDMDERGADSRERLEADLEDMVRSWCADDIGVKATRGAIMYWRVKELLDRQVAITERKCQASSTWALQERYKALNQVAELTAERDKWASNAETGFKRIKELEAERDELETKHQNDYDAWQLQMDKLQAERDELQAAIDAMNNGQFYSMYKAKCEECEQLKKVVRTQAESFKKLECELAGKQ